MKFKIDTKTKTFTLEDSATFGELFELLHSIFPSETWKDYKLEVVKEIEKWTAPVVIPYPYPSPFPYEPHTYPTYPWTIIYTGNTTNDVPTVFCCETQNKTE